MKKALTAVLIVALLAVFGYSAYRIGDYLLEMRRSEKDTQEAAKYVEVPHVEDRDLNDMIYPDKLKNEFLVNFEELWKINPDIVAWIYSPDTPINYPVVQAEDNAKYLRRLLDGSWNIAGTLFLDFRCQPDFTSTNNIIYGHHMKYGTMFGSLVKYRSQSYYDTHPMLFLATPDQVYRVDLFAGCTIDSLDDIYQAYVTPEQIQAMIRNSTFRSSREISVDGPILTLSTCAYDFDGARYVVMGALIPTK